MASSPRFPLKDGATCGDCGGPVDAFGCAAKCAGSEYYRVQTTHLVGATPEARLAQIKLIAETELRMVRPEFVAPALVAIYEITAEPLPRQHSDVQGGDR